MWSLKILQSVQLERNRSVLSGLRFLQTSMIHRVHRYRFFSSVACRTPASINKIFIRIYNNIDATQQYNENWIIKSLHARETEAVVQSLAEPGKTGANNNQPKSYISRGAVGESYEPIRSFSTHSRKNHVVSIHDYQRWITDAPSPIFTFHVITVM